MRSFICLILTFLLTGSVDQLGHYRTAKKLIKTTEDYSSNHLPPPCRLFYCEK